MNLTPHQDLPRAYVHLTSELAEECCPADTVQVRSDTVDVLNHGQPVARFSAREVLFCTHFDVSLCPFSGVRR